jgi:hypothetical protein
VTVAAGSDIQIVGDGPGATTLQGSGFAGPVLALDGPSRAVVRDLLISGQAAAVGLSLRNANQTGALIHAEDTMATGRVVGLQVDGLSHTALDLLDFQAGGQSDTPGSTAVQLLHGSKATIFNGALGADSVYDVRDNSSLVAQTVYEEAVSQRPVSVLAAGGSGKVVLDSGKLHSYTPGTFDASTFSGLITVANMGSSGVAFKAGADFLGLGVLSDTGTLDDSTAPYAWWLPRQADGSGTKPTPEQSNGIADPKQYVRDHLAPLRAAKPRPLSGAPAGATDVRLYRVFIDTASTALRIEGSAP